MADKAWLGSTLDLAETARQVLALAVPRLAHSGAVYLREPLMGGGSPGTISDDSRIVACRVAVTGPPGLEGCPSGWDSFAPGSDIGIFASGTPQARCLATGEPVRYGSGTGPAASFLAVPLTARSEIVGLLLLARPEGRPGFYAGDVAAATELAQQAGVCVDNARLFTQERRLAEALQRGLLPREPPALTGLDVAHCYRPAGDNLVGGDWYDVIPLPGGRTTIVVGDTMGHGPEAATVMVQLRAGAHVLADLGMEPDALLDRLNRMANSVTTGTFATCVCATLNPATGSAVVARAGHLPPVRALRDGSTDVIDIPPGLPLGLGETTYEAAYIKLPAGAMLALYTDGLVESRFQSFDDGITALRSALASPAGQLQPACDAILDGLCQRGEDDTTLVLARVPGTDTGADSDEPPVHVRTVK